MYTAKIRFETLDEAKAFVDICNKVDFKVELQDDAVSYTHLTLPTTTRV